PAAPCWRAPASPGGAPPSICACDGVGGVRLLFATDPHGNEAAYDGLVACARERDVDAVVLGGDLLPLGGGDRLTRQLTFAREWLPAWLERVRAACGARVCAILGNDDWACCAPHLEALEGLTLLHGRAAPLDGRLSIAGYP